MKHSSSLLRAAAGATLVVAVAVAGPASVSLAQTASPPPASDPVVSLAPGTDVVEPSVPAVAPDGIPAILGHGTLAVVPPAPEGTVSLVNADLGGGYQATAVVAADPAAAVAVAVTAHDPSSVPGLKSGPAVVVSVEVYDLDTAEVINSPVTLGISVPDGVDPATVSVVHYDPATGEYQTLSPTVNPETGVLQVQIP